MKFNEKQASFNKRLMTIQCNILEFKNSCQHHSFIKFAFDKVVPHVDLKDLSQAKRPEVFEV